MRQTQSQKLTFAEYLAYEDDTDNRYELLVVIGEEHLTLMGKRLTIALEMPPPRFVVEVVSPGKVNQENDYI
jgi:Uma2 family endonuclease